MQPFVGGDLHGVAQSVPVGNYRRIQGHSPGIGHIGRNLCIESLNLCFQRVLPVSEQTRFQQELRVPVDALSRRNDQQVG